jgi:hypothetical protein
VWLWFLDTDFCADETYLVLTRLAGLMIWIGSKMDVWRLVATPLTCSFHPAGTRECMHLARERDELGEVRLVMLRE